MPEIVDPDFARYRKAAAKPPAGTSQFGEHVLVHAVFGRKRHGYAVDVGASNGISNSNTFDLERRGWTVLCIEPNPLYAPALTNNRKTVISAACGARRGRKFFSVYDVGGQNYEACSALQPNQEAVKIHGAKLVRKVKVDVWTLDECLVTAKFPRLDLLSIDVEGAEADVLAGFDIDRWKPKMVIIEDWQGGDFRRWFCAHGYYVLKRLGPNEVFIRG